MHEPQFPPAEPVTWTARSLSPHKPGRCVLRAQLWAQAREKAAAELGVNTDQLEVHRGEERPS